MFNLKNTAYFIKKYLKKTFMFNQQEQEAWNKDSLAVLSLEPSYFPS